MLQYNRCTQIHFFEIFTFGDNDQPGLVEVYIFSRGRRKEEYKLGKGSSPLLSNCKIILTFTYDEVYHISANLLHNVEVFFSLPVYFPHSSDLAILLGLKSTSMYIKELCHLLTPFTLLLHTQNWCHSFPECKGFFDWRRKILLIICLSSIHKLFIWGKDSIGFFK